MFHKYLPNSGVHTFRLLIESRYVKVAITPANVIKVQNRTFATATLAQKNMAMSYILSGLYTGTFIFHILGKKFINIIIWTKRC